MARKILLIASLALIISFSSAYADSISVEINDKSHEIEYTPFKLTVTGVEADIDFGSLIFSVNVVEDNASLKIVFDRILLDSKYQGQDGDFFVLADGEEVEFDEKKTATQRTLTFAVEMGTEEIEVIGSHIAGIAIFESTKMWRKRPLRKQQLKRPQLKRLQLKRPQLKRLQSLNKN